MPQVLMYFWIAGIVAIIVVLCTDRPGGSDEK